MQVFKRFVFSLMTLLLMTACQPKEQNAGNSNGEGQSFHLDKVMVNNIGKVFTSTQEKIFKKFNTGFWNYPRANEYRVVACLSDKIYNKSIQGHQFTIINTEDKKMKTATSNNEGCIAWKETLHFNIYKKEPNYLLFERKVRGHGIYDGHVMVKYAINPWQPYRKSQGDEVVILKESGGQKLKRLVTDQNHVRSIMTGNGDSAELHMKDVKIGTDFFRPRKNGWNVHVNLEMTPEVRMKDIDGRDKSNDLQTGKYKVYAYFLATGQGLNSSKMLFLNPTLGPECGLVNFDDKKVLENIKKNRTKSQKEGKVKSCKNNYLLAKAAAEDGDYKKLKVSFDFDLKRKVTKGKIFLVMRVVPVGDSPIPGGSNYDGVYEIGPYNQFHGQKSLNLSFKNFRNAVGSDFVDYDTFIRSFVNLKEGFIKPERDTKMYGAIVKDLNDSAERNEETNKIIRILKPNLHAYEFSTFDANYERIAPGETATTRAIVFRVWACPLHGQFGTKVLDEYFMVNIKRDVLRGNRKLEQSKEDTFIRPKQDRTGCLYWTDQVAHKYYAKESLRVNSYQLINRRSCNKNDQKNLVTIHQDKNSYMARENKEFRSCFSHERHIGFNPWDDKFTFKRDMSIFTQKYKQQLTDSKDRVRSRFFIPGFGYQTLRFRYEIDEYLNLTVKKTVQIRLEPTVLRYSGIVSGRSTTEQLRDGIYLAKLAIQKDYLDPAEKGVSIQVDPEAAAEVQESLEEKSKLVGEAQKAVPLRADYNEVLKKGKRLVPQFKLPKDWRSWSKPRQQAFMKKHLDARREQMKQYISVVKKLVRVHDGIIITPVEFSVRDLRLMRIRANMLIQLEPIDERALIVKNTLVKSIEKEVKSGIDKMKAQFKADNDGKERFKSAQEEMAYRQGQIGQHMRKVEEILDQLMKAYKVEQEEKFESSFDQPEDDQSTYRAINNPQRIEKLLHPFDIYNEVEKVLKEVDFSIASIKPDVPLEQLIDKDAGIDKRTFIGPVTFLLNSNNSYLRPTDNLDTAHCNSVDCNQLTIGEQKIGAEYEGSRYFGAVKHMLNVHVDDLIKAKEKLDEKFNAKMKVASLTNKYLVQNRLKYVSLTDEPIVRFNDEDCLHYIEMLPEGSRPPKDCLIDAPERVVKKGVLLDYIKKPMNRLYDNDENITYNQEDIEKLVETGELPIPLEVRLCKFWSDHILNAQGESQNLHMSWHSNKKRLDWIFQECAKKRGHQLSHWVSRQFGGGQSPFNVNRKLRIYKINKDRYRYKGGKNMNINVGANFTLTEGETFSTSHSFDIAGKIFNLLGSKFLSVSYTDSRNKSKGTSVNSQTFLVMQMATIDFEVELYERCAVITLNHEWAHRGQVDSRFKILNGSARIDLAKRGLMICTGAKVVSESLANSMKERNERIDSLKISKPLTLRERFYYFTQHFTDGDILDPGDLYNHPWLLQLRGVRDIRAFLGLIRSKGAVNLVNLKGITNVDSDDLKIKEEWPIEKLAKTYKNVLPSFPKIYSIVEGEQKYLVDYPWDEDPNIRSYKFVGNGIHHEHGLEDPAGEKRINNSAK